MIRIMERSTYRSIGFEMSGMVTLEELKKVTGYFEVAIEARGILNWLAVFKGLVCFTPSAFVHDLRFNSRNGKHFKKKAIVCHSALFKLAIKSLGPLFGMKQFDLSEIESAWRYVES